jgi:hypothetical protein
MDSLKKVYYIKLTNLTCDYSHSSKHIAMASNKDEAKIIFITNQFWKNQEFYTGRNLGALPILERERIAIDSFSSWLDKNMIEVNLLEESKLIF